MKTTLLVGLMLVFSVACGKKDSSSSGSSAFRSGVSATDEGLVIIPNNTQIMPTISVSGRVYSISTYGTSQSAWQTLNALYSGSTGIPPRSQDANGRTYRARITASLSMGGYGQNGYAAGGYQQPVQSNVLDVQSIQPY